MRNYFHIYCGFPQLNTRRSALHLLRNYLRIYCGTVSAIYPHHTDFRSSILLVPHFSRNYFCKIFASCAFLRLKTPRSAFISAMHHISACRLAQPNTPHFLCIICRNRSAKKLRISALFAAIWTKGISPVHQLKLFKCFHVLKLSKCFLLQSSNT